MKKILSLILAIAMIASVVSGAVISVSADENITGNDGITANDLSVLVEETSALLYQQHSEQTRKYLYDRYQRAQATLLNNHAYPEDIEKAYNELENAVSLLAPVLDTERVNLFSFDSVTTTDLMNMECITGTASLNAIDKPESAVQAIKIAADDGVAYYSNTDAEGNIVGVSPFGIDMTDTDGLKLWVSVSAPAVVDITIGKHGNKGNTDYSVKGIKADGTGFITLYYDYFATDVNGMSVIMSGLLNYFSITCSGADEISFADLHAFREVVEQSNATEYREEQITTKNGIEDFAYYKLIESSTYGSANPKAVTLGPIPNETATLWDNAVATEATMQYSLVPSVPGDLTQLWQLAPDPSGNGTYRIICKASGCAMCAKDSSLSYRQLDYNDTKEEFQLSATKGAFTIQIRNVGKLTAAGETVKLTAGSTYKKFCLVKVTDCEYVQTWSDEFEEDKPDSSVWNVYDGFFFGGGNSSLHYDSEDVVFTRDGKLVLKTNAEDYNGYQSTAQLVTTSGKYAITYGRMDIMARMPRGMGMWPSLWLMPTDSMNMARSEIDLMEMPVQHSEYIEDGKGDRLYSRHIGTYHWADSNGKHEWSKPVYIWNENYVDMCEDFHLYSVEIDTNQIRMYFDNALYSTLNLCNEGLKYAYGDIARYLIVGCGGIQGDGSCILYDQYEYFDREMEIEYVRSYAKTELLTDSTPDFTLDTSKEVSSTPDVFARYCNTWMRMYPMAVSPDGSQAAMADMSGFVHVINPNNNEVIADVSCGDINSFCSAAFSPDGSKFAAATYHGCILIYDTSDYTKAPVRILNGATMQYSLLFTADSRYVVTGGFNGGAQTYKNPIDGRLTAPYYFRVFNAATGAVAHEIFLDDSTPLTLKLSPDGTKLAVTTISKGIFVFNTSDWSEYAHFTEGHVNTINDCEFSPNGLFLASCDEAGKIIVWDLENKTESVRMANANAGSVRRISYSPDGNSIVATSNDTAAKIFNAKTGRCISLMGGFGSVVREVEYSPNGRFIVVASMDHTMRVYSSNGTYLETLVQGDDLTDEGFTISDILFTPDSKYVLCSTASYPRAINRWRLPEYETGKSALKQAMDNYWKCDEKYERAEAVYGLKYATPAMVYESIEDLNKANIASFDAFEVSADNTVFSDSISVHKGAWLYFRAVVSDKAEKVNMFITNVTAEEVTIIPVDESIRVAATPALNGYSEWTIKLHLDTAGNCVVNIGNPYTKEYSQIIKVFVDDNETVRDLLYTVTDENTVTITGCTSGKGDVYIPDYIDGYPVTRIGAYAFSTYGQTAKHMTLRLPSTLKVIEQYAFKECTSLKKLDLPDGLERIEDHAFERCLMLEDVRIPASVTYLGTYAFNYVRGTNFIEVGGGITTVPTYAFISTIGNRCFIFDEGVTKVNSSASNNAPLVKAIYMPRSMTSFSTSSIASTRGIVKIYGYKGTYAETFANQYPNRYVFVELANPVISGIEDGQTIDLKDGAAPSATWDDGHIAYLNGERYVAGTPVAEPGEYTLKVKNGYDEFTTEIHFTVADTTPEPAVDGIKDGAEYDLYDGEPVSLTWTPAEATATLNGTAYTAGTEITEPGEYKLVVTNGTKTTEINFTVKDTSTVPVISGVEEGREYDLYAGEKPSATWDAGEATLNGEPYVAGTAIEAVGEYKLVVVNGTKSAEVNFKVVDNTPPYTPGDFDNDGQITVADALAALRIGAKLVEETPESIAIGDVDNDGHVTVADALAILRVAAKLVDHF